MSENMDLPSTIKKNITQEWPSHTILLIEEKGNLSL